MSGRDSGSNGKVEDVGLLEARVNSMCSVDVGPDDACSFPARIILRCRASYAACTGKES
jgi:hypothetical protein